MVAVGIVFAGIAHFFRAKHDGIRRVLLFHGLNIGVHAHFAVLVAPIHAPGNPIGDAIFREYKSDGIAIGRGFMVAQRSRLIGIIGNHHLPIARWRRGWRAIRILFQKIQRARSQPPRGSQILIVYVKDNVRAIKHFLDTDAKGYRQVCQGKPYHIMDIAAMIAEAVPGTKVELVESDRPHDIQRLWGFPTLPKDFEFTPMDKAIADTVAYYAGTR